MPLQPAEKARIPCKNVRFHGYCKMQDKGCEYNHDASNTTSAPSPAGQQHPFAAAVHSPPSNRGHQSNGSVGKQSPGRPGSLSYASITNPAVSSAVTAGVSAPALQTGMPSLPLATGSQGPRPTAGPSFASAASGNSTRGTPVQMAPSLSTSTQGSTGGVKITNPTTGITTIVGGKMDQKQTVGSNGRKKITITDPNSRKPIALGNNVLTSENNNNSNNDSDSNASLLANIPEFNPNGMDSLYDQHDQQQQQPKTQLFHEFHMDQQKVGTHDLMDPNNHNHNQHIEIADYIPETNGMDTNMGDVDGAMYGDHGYGELEIYGQDPNGYYDGSSMDPSGMTIPDVSNNGAGDYYMSQGYDIPVNHKSPGGEGSYGYHNMGQQQQQQHSPHHHNAQMYGLQMSPGSQQQGIHDPVVGMGVGHHVGMPQVEVKQPLNYHLYRSPLPHVTRYTGRKKVASNVFFINDGLREELQRKLEDESQIPDQNLVGTTVLPREVFHYHTLCPLDRDFPISSKTFGFPTLNYKAFCMNTNKIFALRRIAQFRLMNDSMLTACEPWKALPAHPGIVGINDAFTTRAFGDNSLVFAYDYFPLSKTLYEKYIVGYRGTSGNNFVGVEESVIWSLVLQISSALKLIHSFGLAARTVEPSKIIETGKNRFRLNCCGILDVTEYSQKNDITVYQQDDLQKLGQLILVLCTRSLKSLNLVAKSIDYIGKFYSPSLKELVIYLLSKPSITKSIDDIVAIAGPILLTEATSSYANNDFLESQLTRELENGRISRLLLKLGFINERPEYHHDITWSETGDRYLLKLFRDYVFHQCGENGEPIVDLAFVLQCLNKLDAGVDEKIMLTSRDEQACLVVSYKDLKNCIGNTFNELLM